MQILMIFTKYVVKIVTSNNIIIYFTYMAYVIQDSIDTKRINYSVKLNLLHFINTFLFKLRNYK